MNTVRITPPKGPLTGALTLPGSKSITNRALLIAAMAKGTSRLTGALGSHDTGYMAQALRAMGVTIDEPLGETTFVVTGTGGLKPFPHPINIGNAGTAARFLCAAATVVDGAVVIDGDEHMRKRPIKPLVDALAELGVDALAPTGCPPVTVIGTGGMPGGRIEIDASLSSQYVSALLMAAPCAKGPVEISLKGADIGARGYVDLTLAVMKAFGARVEVLGRSSWGVTPTGYSATDFAIEPDASAATYPWAWEAITGGNVDLGWSAGQFTQPDAAAHAFIAAFPHMPAVIDGSQMQDAVPTLAVLAAYNESPVRFTRIANLRVKECDRISALSQGLNRIKPNLSREDGDDLIVNGDPALRGAVVAAVIDPWADHRIAMSFAVAGLVTEGIQIGDYQCVAKTWPGYWGALKDLGVQLTFS